MRASGSLIDALTTALAARPGVVSAYLFGSQAEGRAHRDSDVDVGILLSRTVHPGPVDRFDERLHLASRLGAAVGCTVDVVILNDAPPHLARRVMTAGRRLLLNDVATDHAHRRTMLSRAADLDPFLRRARAVKLGTLAR